LGNDRFLLENTRSRELVNRYTWQDIFRKKEIYMTLQELICTERRACPDTSSDSWKRRCEEFHYANLSALTRKARFAAMLAKGRDPADVEVLAKAAEALSRRFSSTPSKQASPRLVPQAGASTPVAAATPATPAWSPQHDVQLAKMAEEGKAVGELAVFFGRSEGALTARLKRLASLH
jgi:hypothetical protein